MGIKQFITATSYWTLPPGVRDIILKIADHADIALRNRKHRSVLKVNKKLQGIHQGERCFILATGASINGEDLKDLSGEKCIAVSNFFVHPDFKVIKPAYYCIAPYHKPITEAAWHDWMQEIDSNTRCGSESATMFFGITDLERNKQDGLFEGRQIHFLSFMDEAWDDFVAGKLELAGQIPSIQSVSVMAIMIAIYMGFNEIYLLGCDHNWITTVGKGAHFYDEQQHKLVQDGYNEWSNSDLEPYFSDYIRLWGQYKKIREFAAQRNVQIINLTVGSLLDVFPRKTLKSVIAGNNFLRN